jgi:hypothetical protein
VTSEQYNKHLTELNGTADDDDEEEEEEGGEVAR